MTVSSSSGRRRNTIKQNRLGKQIKLEERKQTTEETRGSSDLLNLGLSGCWVPWDPTPEDQMTQNEQNFKASRRADRIHGIYARHTEAQHEQGTDQTDPQQQTWWYWSQWLKQMSIRDTYRSGAFMLTWMSYNSNGRIFETYKEWWSLEQAVEVLIYWIPRPSLRQSVWMCRIRSQVTNKGDQKQRGQRQSHSKRGPRLILAVISKTQYSKVNEWIDVGKINAKLPSDYLPKVRSIKDGLGYVADEDRKTI